MESSRSGQLQLLEMTACIHLALHAPHGLGAPGLPLSFPAGLLLGSILLRWKVVGFIKPIICFKLGWVGGSATLVAIPVKLAACSGCPGSCVLSLLLLFCLDVTVTFCNPRGLQHQAHSVLHYLPRFYRFIFTESRCYLTISSYCPRGMCYFESPCG